MVAAIEADVEHLEDALAFHLSGICTSMITVCAEEEEVEEEGECVCVEEEGRGSVHGEGVMVVCVTVCRLPLSLF